MISASRKQTSPLYFCEAPGFPYFAAVFEILWLEDFPEGSLESAWLLSFSHLASFLRLFMCWAFPDNSGTRKSLSDCLLGLINFSLLLLRFQMHGGKNAFQTAAFFSPFLSVSVPSKIILGPWLFPTTLQLCPCWRSSHCTLSQVRSR